MFKIGRPVFLGWELSSIKLKLASTNRIWYQSLIQVFIACGTGLWQGMWDHEQWKSMFDDPIERLVNEWPLATIPINFQFLVVTRAEHCNNVRTYRYKMYCRKDKYWKRETRSWIVVFRLLFPRLLRQTSRRQLLRDKFSKHSFFISSFRLKPNDFASNFRSNPKLND